MAQYNDSRWGYPTKVIDELAVHVGSGVTPTGGAKVYRTEGILFIRSQNVHFSGLKLDDAAFIDIATHASMARSEVHAHDVLLNITGASIGRCCAVPTGLGTANVNQHVCAIRLPFPSEFDAAFLSAILSSHTGQAQIEQLNAGSNRQGLNYQQIRSFSIPWPDAPTRKVVAEILDRLNKVIRKSDEIIAKLKQVKRGLLHDLLTRGIDDNGELRDSARHPEQFKNSPLGKIPLNWKIAPLGQVVPRAVYGISASLDAGSGIPVLRMNNLHNGEAELSELKYSASSEAQDLLLRPGDVLFNRTNSIDHVGRTGIWRGQIERASFASYLVRLDVDPACLKNEFLCRWPNWEDTQTRIRRYATPGVHQVNINPTNLRKTPMALPVSLLEQDAIVSGLAAIDRRHDTEAVEREKLGSLRRGLMEDLLTGRVQVTGLLREGAA